MVSFRTIIASALALSVTAAQVTPAQIVSNIKSITQKSQALQAPSQSISIVNGPLIVIGQGPFPVIITGFVDIVSTATTAISQMDGMAPVAAGADSDKIYDAFREFVRVHQALLNILIGKAGLFETVPFIGQPISQVLRQVEGVVDTIALGLVDNVQSRASDLQNQANSLGMTLDTCINSFSGINTSKRSVFRFARGGVAIAA